MKLMFRATILCLILINFLITTAYSQDVSFYCPCPDENYVPKTYQIPGIVEAEGFMEGGALVGYYNIPQDEDLTGKTALRVSDVEILCLLALDENYLCLEPEDIGDLVVESINVGYLNPYEWLRYSVEVLESGSYTVSYSVSKNADSTLTTFFLVLNSLIPVSETLCLDSADSDSKVGLWSEVFPDDTEISSYKSFYTKKALIPFSLEKGTVDIILCMDDEVEFVNINSLVFELQEPSDTLAPTALPTLAPTALPTLAPTSSPTPLPTPVPTLTPTSSPTPLPTPVPTLAPTSSPTPLPTPVPTLAPTSSPTPLPTPVPTLAPTSSPTPLPTPVPTHGTPTPTSFELYTAKFNSTFVNQSSWESSYLDKIFTESIVAIVCAECSAEIDEIRESTYVLSRERKLQTNSGEYDSIEVLFQVQNSSKQSEAALIEASESGSLLKVMSESSPAGLITATYIVTVSISDAELETASDDDESKNLLPIIASASVFGILICACIVIGGFIHKVKMAKRIDDECSTRDLEVSGFERYDKPDLFEEGWRTAGVLVSNIPYISNVYAMCNEIVLQFSTTLEMNENCRKVINWTINMQKFLRKVQEFAEANPKAEIDIGTTDLKECLNLVTVLLESTKAYKENRLFDQFTASRKLQKLTDDIWSSLSKAIQRIELSVNVTSLELNLHIDENVSVLISAVDHLDVKMTVIGENLSRFEDKFDRIVDSSMRHKQPSNSSIIECDPGLTDNVYSKVSATLGQLEHSTAGYKILNKKPIGVGATAKVYMVEYDGKVRAAKVTELGNMSAEQLQKVYFKLARELYTLTLLKHERIVELCGTITTIERFSLILEYMPLGSLRGMLNNFKQWEKLSQYNRHGILCDVCEGVAFLHDRGMHHRDLKSDNVLITNDFRAKLSDFGLSRTINSVSMFSKTGANTGGTLRFLPPEYFIHRSDPIKNPGEKRDVYSYGMVTFEVLSGIFGPEKSMPYSNLSYVDIELSIVKGQHPILSDGWDDRRNVYCSSEHAMIMRKCLSLQPSDRPSFTDIMHILNIGKSCNKDTGAGCYG